VTEHPFFDYTVLWLHRAVTQAATEGGLTLVSELDGARSARTVRANPGRSTWSTEVARTVARQVRYWRGRRRLSAQALAIRTKALGHEVPRSVLANLENGRRDALGFADLLVLAAALDVPPVLLFAALGYEREVEVLPELRVAPWEARGWFHGAIDPPYEGCDVNAWQESRRVIALYDVHRLLVRELRQVENRVKRIADQDQLAAHDIVAGDILARTGSLADAATEFVYSIDRLRSHRRLIASEGFLLPNLPPDIAVRMAEEGGGRHRRAADQVPTRRAEPPVLFDQLRSKLPKLDHDPASLETQDP
jgi:transcriptional regulator with XRE-family HTH domain